MTPEQEQEVECCLQPEFAVHKLNEDGIEKARFIGESFSSLLLSLKEMCIDGRELSICKTKLEEACFFAKKSMAINLINQKHD